MNNDIDGLTGVLRALGDPTRLRILALLGRGDICVCHIHESLRISQTKASRHLAYLRRAGLVESDKRGLWVHYRIARQLSPSIARVLDALLREMSAADLVSRDRTRLTRVLARDGIETPADQCCGVDACCEPETGEAIAGQEEVR